MSDTQFYLRNLWRWKCGLPEEEPGTPKEQLRYEDLQKSEWSDEFEGLMRNRLVMGTFRYGKIGQAGKPVYNRAADVVRRMKQYEDSGNKELLVDVANLCLLEFVECRHPKAHFASVDDGAHTERIE